MKEIVKRRNIFAVFTGLGFAASLSIVLCGICFPDMRIWMLLPVSIPAGVCAAVFWVREYKKLQTARLIAENQILRISTAVISDQTGGGKPENTESIEVIISCFGILFDSKIIRFNQNGILLKAVEIGREHISFSYGRAKRLQKSRLLNTALNEDELKYITERFYDETGVMPVIVT